MDVIDEPAINRPVANRFFVFICGLAFLFLAIHLWRDSQRGQLENPREPSAPLIEIDINDATLQEWTLMPGVGPILAERIVDERRKNGPYESLDDLRRVRGIGDKILKEMRPFCK